MPDGVRERAERTKAALEAAAVARQEEARSRRARLLEHRAALAVTPPEGREALEAAFAAREGETLRITRRRFCAADFETICILGRGAFGEVTLSKPVARASLPFPPGLPPLVAIKRISKDVMAQKNQFSHVLSERLALAELGGGGYVAKLHIAFQDDDALYLVMSVYWGGDLMGLLIKRDVLHEETARFICAELVACIGAVHAAGFVHRDIKPDNVLFDESGHCCLSDLGLCRSVYEAVNGEGKTEVVPDGSVVSTPHVAKSRRILSVVGTPDYIAREGFTVMTESSAAMYVNAHRLLFGHAVQSPNPLPQPKFSHVRATASLLTGGH